MAGVMALPSSLCKQVIFMRHGHGFHNGNTDWEMWRSWKFFDAHLTSLGWKQAVAAGEHLRQRSVQVDLVVVSPLIRTLETAAGAFGQHSPPDGEPTRGVWMEEVHQEEGKRSAMTQIGLPKVPVIAHEDCRETIGVNPCDKRRAVSAAKLQFPGVDFGLIESDEDVLWREDVRESHQEKLERAMRFAKWLAERPEKVIAVVSHCDFLHAFFANFGHGFDPAVTMQMQQPFQNCEVRSMVMLDAYSAKNLHQDPLHFRGGPNYASCATNGSS